MQAARKADGALLRSALGKYALGAVLTALLLFLPAGTLVWFHGWLLLAVLFLPMLGMLLFLLLRSPDLLRSRLEAKESQSGQRTVIRLSGLLFAVGFLTAGLDFRYAWSAVPRWVSLAAAALLLAAWGLYAEVLRENAYLSRAVQVQEGQRVVDTGLYSVVRHPMYAATLLLFLSIPLVLGSLWSLLLFLGYPVLLRRRIRDEEALLTAQLPGYEDYCRRVRWRLFPGLW